MGLSHSCTQKHPSIPADLNMVPSLLCECLAAVYLTVFVMNWRWKTALDLYKPVWGYKAGFPCMYMFPLVRFSARFHERENVFPCTRKRVCGITEFARLSLGIFIAFTSSVVHMHVASVWATCAWKSCSSSNISACRKSTHKQNRVHGNGDRKMHWRCFSAHGNAHMESWP